LKQADSVDINSLFELLFMRRPRFRFRVYRVFWVLCACAFLLSIWLGGFSARPQLAVQANEEIQSQEAQTLVQMGVEHYQAGNYPKAVEPWLMAYTAYETTQVLPALAIVSENLARAYQQMGQTATEIEYWQTAIASIAATESVTDSTNNKLGRLLSEQAQAYSRLGQHRRAIALLCGEVDADDNTANAANVIPLNSLNADLEACLPGSALGLAESAVDTLGQVAALGSLGEAYRLSGDIQTAIEVLDKAVEISRGLDNEVIKSTLFNSLGNASDSQAQVSYRRAKEAAARGDRDADDLRAEADSYNAAAIRHFQESYQRSPDGSAAELSALLSLIPAYERADDEAAARQYWQLANDALVQLPNSQTKAFAAIKLAGFLEPLRVRESSSVQQNAKPPAQANAPQVKNLLEQALAIGESLDSPRIVSFALGELGHLDEQLGNYEQALKQTQQARLAADQDLAARDSLYRWEWQMGRILRAQGNLPDALQSYRQAVNLLEQIRSDILNASRDLQFDFRDTVEPVYRQYAELNLKEVPTGVTLQDQSAAFTELDTTLVTLDSLKVAELQSYFANDCVIAPVDTRVDAVGDSEATAVISTAILTDDSSAVLNQLAVIVSLPDGRKKVIKTPVEATQLESTINQFRSTLESGNSEYISEYNFAPSQQLYTWLIRPFETDLAGVKTLVFVNDGLLRSVPMAALHDGEQYLIEKFAVATTPSLTLTDPQRIPRSTDLSALLMGVSEIPTVEDNFFEGLPAVTRELDAVSQKLPNHKILLNEAFSLSALRDALKQSDYRILHMATHGTFGFDPSDNFLVIGAKQTDEIEAFNETLTIGQLDRLIRSVSEPTREPIELLTLTACETAIGDNRSTLGLAGVAIRAGVRSAIATLWSVSDGSSADLITQFYDKLQSPALTKAEALREAQIAMIRSESFVDNHPYRWAPFILIGNWL